MFDEKKKIVRAYLPHLQEAQELGDRAEYNALIDERDNELAPIEHKIKETNSKIDTVYKKGQNLLSKTNVQQEVRIQHKRVKTLKVNFINA
ncbi:hypothetical protein [uncultured Helicobacter sp.]|uniref:hypothetical protein n=1 Tax=uncultured Helicobacter sp. TaxID=175537 RepID=UPI002632CEAB|nr:hypothetical protein [uncultured Helicobacter sp.]